MPTGLHCLLEDGINYRQGGVLKCSRPGMADSETKSQSHDEGMGGISVTRIHGSVMGEKYESVTGLGAWKCNKWTQKGNRGMVK